MRLVASRRMVVAGLMGFASGLPLLLIGTLLQAWLTDAGVSIQIIGLFALAGLPYTLKFLWAPLMDRYTPGWLGRRRGWLFIVQVFLAASIALLGFTGVPHARSLSANNVIASLGGLSAGRALLLLPHLISLQFSLLGDELPALMAVAGAALLVSFFSATQDTIIDAYRRETLSDEEQGLGASIYVWGYRLAMLLASGGGLILAQHLPFPDVYYLMASVMFIGLATTLFAKEPELQAPPPQTLRTAVIEPFFQFFRERRTPFLILSFILLYKLGDSMALSLATPYYLQLGYSKETIGIVVKLFGFWAIIAGGLIGGALILRIGLYRALWIFGLLQALSTATFAWLTFTGPVVSWLAAVITFENLASGMSTAAFIGFMAILTDRRFTATQYALLSSLMGVPRVLISSLTGFLAASLGWPIFFLLCAFLATPGLTLLTRFRVWLNQPTTHSPVSENS